MTDRVQLEIQDGIAHVRMNRPDKKNALDSDMFSGLIDAADRVAADTDVRVVVLSGAGDSFCSGLDFSSFDAMAQGDLDADDDRVRDVAADLSPDGANRAQQLGWRWQELDVPVIAAVQGAAYGGGFHIALGADIRFIAPDARIAFVEITWGLVPDLSGTQALRRLVPLDVAKKLIFSGEPISGEQAVALHLGTELADDPLAAAFALARTIASRSPDALREAKRLLNASGLVSLREGLANEFAASARLMGGKNQIEAVMAKMQKRAPSFSPPAG